jgi:hypothetical protein
MLRCGYRKNKVDSICIIGINRLKEKFHRKEDLNVKVYDV